MTAADYTQFVECFGRLAVALREETDPAQQRIYFEALAPYPLNAVVGAADLLSRKSTWFPKTSEWVEAIPAAKSELLRRALPPARTEPWHHECRECEDTGWINQACDGTATCGRKRQHAAHAFVQPCPCRPTNATYRRHHMAPSGQEQVVE